MTYADLGTICSFALFLLLSRVNTALYYSFTFSLPLSHSLFFSLAFLTWHISCLVHFLPIINCLLRIQSSLSLSLFSPHFLPFFEWLWITLFATAAPFLLLFLSESHTQASFKSYPTHAFIWLTSNSILCNIWLPFVAEKLHSFALCIAFSLFFFPFFSRPDKESPVTSAKCSLSLSLSLSLSRPVKEKRKNITGTHFASQKAKWKS